ncbi:MAG TPA: permease-like cell division protein FtsX [Acidimicrobiia bacterium]
MSRVLFLLREAMISLRRNMLVVAGAILAVFISLSLALGAMVVNEILRINTIAWQEGVHVIAFLNDEGESGVTAGAHTQLLAEIQGWDEVQEAFYFDKTRAWAEYQELFAGQPELLAIDPTILPASIRIELTDIELHQSVRFRLEQRTGSVRQVATAAESIEQLQSLSSVLNVLGLGMAVVLGVAAVVLIANTIRLAIYARRDEVSIMKLVGASNWFIRVPFLLEGLIEGLVGAALAVFVVWLGATNLAEAGQTFALFRLDVSQQFFFRWGLLFMVFGAGAGVIGSMLGLSKYLRDADGTGPDVPTGF